MDESYQLSSLTDDDINRWTQFCANCFSYKANPPPASYFENHYRNDPRRDSSLIRVIYFNDANNNRVESNAEGCDKKIIVSKKTQGSTCPKPRRPPCKNGFESRKNPQGYDCCFKIPKKKPVKRKTTPKVKNTKITYDKDGIMKIGGKKCKGLSKKVLLEVSKKLGVVGIKNKQKK